MYHRKISLDLRVTNASYWSSAAFIRSFSLVSTRTPEMYPVEIITLQGGMGLKLAILLFLPFTLALMIIEGYYK